METKANTKVTNNSGIHEIIATILNPILEDIIDIFHGNISSSFQAGKSDIEVASNEAVASAMKMLFDKYKKLSLKYKNYPIETAILFMDQKDL